MESHSLHEYHFPYCIALPGVALVAPHVRFGSGSGGAMAPAAITYARQPPSTASTAASFTPSVFPPCMPYLSTSPFAGEPRPPGRLPEQRGAPNIPKEHQWLLRCLRCLVYLSPCQPPARVLDHLQCQNRLVEVQGWRDCFRVNTRRIAGCCPIRWG